MSASKSKAINDVARLLAGATDILFITGAGISADSGIPTYRGVGGLYDGDAQTDDGYPIEEILSGEMFARRPELTWKYLWQIGSACAGAKPNAAHLAIAQLEREKRNVWVITQNVDGLHRAAGTSKLVELHGHAYDLFCTECEHRYDLDGLFEEAMASSAVPRCDDCGGVVRPNVVLFGEMLPPASIAQLGELAQMPFDVVISIGTSMMFPYIHEPIHLAQQHGVPTVEINPCETSVSTVVDHRIKRGAAQAMNQIMACIAAG